MKRFDPSPSSIYLGYCTNVHPGTSVEAVTQRIGTDCVAVQSKINMEINFGISLWLSSKSVVEFKNKSSLLKLRHACKLYGIKIFSWNSFPFSDFHQDLVKSKVYRPNWSEDSRLKYTLELLELIVQLSLLDSPPSADLRHLEISISTLPIADLRAQLSQSEVLKSVEHLVQFAEVAYGLERKFNLKVHLDLEPEPLCFMQTSRDVISFFKNFLLPIGINQLKRNLSVTARQAESILLDKLRVCYDTCHAAILFESPKDILANYDSLGVQVGKVQLSSAVVFYPTDSNADDSIHLLNQLANDRYLHQVIGKSPNDQFESFPDLPNALSAWSNQKPLLDEYRIHFHVPIFLDHFGPLGTTQSHIQLLVELGKTRFITSHWEVETYTWPSLPQEFNKGELSDQIAREINWFHELSKS